jgi:hypothetical protein
MEFTGALADGAELADNAKLGDTHYYKKIFYETFENGPRTQAAIITASVNAPD